MRKLFSAPGISKVVFHRGKLAKLSMEVRQRKNRQNSPGDSMAKKKGSGDATSSAAIDKGCTRLIVAVCCLVSLTISLHFVAPQVVSGVLDKLLSSVGLEQKCHAVVIDAGSTGTRLLAFTFHRGILDSQLHLDDELWQQVIEPTIRTIIWSF